MKIITTSLSLINLINHCFNFVMNISAIYNIDESHALKHSMEVFGYAKKIYDEEVIKNPYLEKHKEIIYMAAIGHDMCDKKYMDEKEGIARLQLHLSEYIPPNELEMIGNIIGTMSYSKVKVNGYPEMGEYQLAYHIVREADLLAAYDIDRCIMYDMYRNNSNYFHALQEAINLFEKRVFKMRRQRLFTTSYAKRESLQLHKRAKKNVEKLQGLFV